MFFLKSMFLVLLTGVFGQAMNNVNNLPGSPLDPSQEFKIKYSENKEFKIKWLGDFNRELYIYNNQNIEIHKIIISFCETILDVQLFINEQNQPDVIIRYQHFHGDIRTVRFIAERELIQVNQDGNVNQ